MKAKKFFTIISTISTLAIMISSSISASANSNVRGDANNDNKVNIRDSAFIANCIIEGNTPSEMADYNLDGKIDIRDAAAISKDIVNGNVKKSTQEITNNNENEASAENYSEKAMEILELVNQERAKVGAAPLTLSADLNAIANERAEESSSKFSHTRPNGAACFSIFDEREIDYSYCGENLAAGSATSEEAMQQWIDSVDHYRNIIDREFTELGVGFYYDENSPYGYYWVQIFVCP